MNRAAARASVFGNCVTWHCICAAPHTLQGRSGSPAGPTRDSVIVCPSCNRVYFVIPLDRAHGPPIEVVELFGLPEAPAGNPAAPSTTPVG